MGFWRSGREAATEAEAGERIEMGRDEGKTSTLGYLYLAVRC